MNSPSLALADAEIMAARGPKNQVDPLVPYAFLVEPERAADGRVVNVATIFLTNRECPFRCLMCDLWKNTTDSTVPLGAIPAQIDYALARLPAAKHLKLYNSGNFFDRQAIPPADYEAIARKADRFINVVVENHPKLCGEECLRFRDSLGGKLEIALGLETVHPEVLAALNKRMTIDDFDRAAAFLVDHGIAVRVFVLVRPPLLDEASGVEWAVRSIEHAFDAGANCASVIPTRGGNGILDRLQADGHFSPPKLISLERVLEAGLVMRRGRVFADLWDAGRLPGCSLCRGERIDRLREMNLSQEVLPPVDCDCRSEP